ncbi:agmatine deiminase [Utexia brackfieldae]|uniref:agmatine deiminase n=1 Tax=Utexia brackfieldae TaxID=3074108 RepID=UPI00370DBCFF
MELTTLATRPSNDGFWMPAEWAAHEAVWMLWPYRADNWRESARPAQQNYAAIAEAISAVTPVFMGVPEELIDQAKRILPSAVTIVPMESDDAWARDCGPTMVINGQGERRGIDWIFNSWGGLKGGLYYPWDKDEQVAPQILSHHQFKRYQAGIVIEGGGIHVDGDGTCIVTEEVHLNPDRNPGLTKEQIEDFLRDYLNVDKIIWLPLGVYEDETSGHIDNMCCFSKPGELLLTWTDDETDPQYARSKAALDVLEKATDAKGRQLLVRKLQQPGPLYITPEEASTIQTSPGMNREAGHRLAGSYVNFLITNGRIILPQFDPKTDANAIKVVQEAFPDHKIIGVPSREILLGGGNIHCITQQIPSGRL